MVSGVMRTDENVVPPILPYPENDEAITSAMDDSGIPYILGKTGKIISFTPKQKEPEYVNITGQEKWE